MRTTEEIGWRNKKISAETKLMIKYPTTESQKFLIFKCEHIFKYFLIRDVIIAEVLLCKIKTFSKRLKLLIVFLKSENL